jgi:hypothetical protein
MPVMRNGKIPGRMTVCQRCQLRKRNSVATSLQVGRNGHGPGNYVEQDVPLRAEKHEQDGANAEAPPPNLTTEQQDDR